MMLLSLWILKPQKALRKSLNAKFIIYWQFLSEWKKSQECYDWIRMFFFFFSVLFEPQHCCCSQMFFDIHEQLPGVDISNSVHFHLPPWHFLKCLPAYSSNNRPAAQERNTSFRSQERAAYLRSSRATNRDISPHDCFINPLCFPRVNNHLKLMKLWLIG